MDNEIDLDEFDEPYDHLKYFFERPLEIPPPHWAAILEAAKLVQDQYKCDYPRAIVAAYLEWFDAAKEADAKREKH